MKVRFLDLEESAKLDSSFKEFKKLVKNWKFDPQLKQSLLDDFVLEDGKPSLFIEKFDGDFLILTNSGRHSDCVLIYVRNVPQTRDSICTAPRNFAHKNFTTSQEARATLVRISKISNAQAVVDFLEKERFFIFHTVADNFIKSHPNK